MILWEKDGVGLMLSGGVLWLFVRDGAGMHSTGLTEETKKELIAQLKKAKTS